MLEAVLRRLLGSSSLSSPPEDRLSRLSNQMKLFSEQVEFLDCRLQETERRLDYMEARLNEWLGVGGYP